MADWSKDEFMQSWDEKYVTTNLKPGDKLYNAEVFLALNKRLCEDAPELKPVSHAIIMAACSALGRADVVGKYFDDVTKQSTPEESQAVFLKLREGMACIYPFVGMPALIPGAFGMIGVIKRKGEEYATLQKFRKGTIDEDNIRKGNDIRKIIYKTAGNSEIMDPFSKFFAELYNGSTAFTWGYLLAAASDNVFDLPHTHFIVATAITALGATRQTRSHLKATMGAGNSTSAVKAMVDVVSEIATWAGRPIVQPDVDALAEEVRSSLKA
ncbi:hypothetical protein PV10_06316 [Exophiala mesophila]|uniref:Uncharacterized protein n=1 Tax=Exophiala mesophila TaxID=212818 RepID=A0A0D1ZCZ4_EXOME|nr:uncharacterized protein PV10_06316 [Exophiala mesophila]KIV91819.1 hypothetical protein PV10_06316 [Exophiala mesophila]